MHLYKWVYGVINMPLLQLDLHRNGRPHSCDYYINTMPNIVARIKMKIIHPSKNHYYVIVNNTICVTDRAALPQERPTGRPRKNS